MASASEDLFKLLPDEILRDVINIVCNSALDSVDNTPEACRQVAIFKAIDRRFKELSSTWASYSEVDNVFTLHYHKKDVIGVAQLVLVTQTRNGCMTILQKVLTEARNTLTNLYLDHSEGSLRESLREDHLDAMCNLLSKCPLLEVLHLTSFQRLVGFKQMEHLRVLKLEHSHDLALDPAAFADLNSLESLTLNDCSAVDGIEVQSKSLKSLTLDSNIGGKISIVASNLDSLTVGSNPALVEVSSVKTLKQLSLHGLGAVIFRCSFKRKMEGMGIFYNWKQETLGDCVLNGLNLQAGCYEAGAHVKVHKLTEASGSVVHLDLQADNLIAVDLEKFESLNRITYDCRGKSQDLSIVEKLVSLAESTLWEVTFRLDGNKAEEFDWERDRCRWSQCRRAIKFSLQFNP